jgi:hypothetical protein
VVGVCIKLHNLCNKHRLNITTCSDDDALDEDENPQAPDGPNAYNQDECYLEQVRTHDRVAGKTKREKLVNDIKQAGLARPAVKTEKYGYYK